MTRYNNKAPHTALDWQQISTVLLDMDGTLLDKYYDDYFWEQFVPQAYARQRGIDRTRAKDELMARYRSVQHTLLWSDLHYWSKELDLDILALKKQISHMITVHPHVVDFLTFLKNQNKSIYLVTAAHPQALEMKMDKAGLAHFFDQLVCADDLNRAKEEVAFWRLLEDRLGFSRDQTLFADDNLKVLRAARSHGIAHLIHIARPSSRDPLNASAEFTSIGGFNELLC